MMHETKQRNIACSWTITIFILKLRTVLTLRIAHRLLGLSKTNSRVADIVDRVPPPEERVSEDSKRTYGLGEVHAKERRDTRSLYFKNVVIGPDREVVAGQGEGEVGQTVTLVALNGVLAVV